MKVFYKVESLILTDFNKAKSKTIEMSKFYNTDFKLEILECTAKQINYNNVISNSKTIFEIIYNRKTGDWR